MDGLTIVTGGAGFIGSHLVDLLLARRERIRVVEKPGASVGHFPPSVEVVFADIRDRESVGKALRGGRRVYHLAANPNLWARDRAEFEAVNHRGTVHVLDAAISEGVERIVHTSTESILTRADMVGPIDENVSVSERDAVGPYCLSKLRAENAAFARARAGHPVVVVNPTMPVGPGDRGLSPPTRLILDFCRGKIPARMDCTLNLIDVRDAALGLARAMDRAVPGRRYLLAGENLELDGLLARLGQLTGVPSPRWRVPYGIAIVVARLSEFRADVLGGPPPKASVTGVRLARRIMHFDPSRSLSELGISPRPVASSLVDAVAWLRDQELLEPSGVTPDRDITYSR